MVEWYGIAVSLNQWRIPAVDRNTGKPIFVLNPRYKQFKEKIKRACFGKIRKYDGYVDLHLWVWLKPNFDTDNILKPICDGIKESRAILDDKYIKDIYIIRDYSEFGKDDIIKFELKESIQNKN